MEDILGIVIMIIVGAVVSAANKKQKAAKPHNSPTQATWPAQPTPAAQPAPMTTMLPPRQEGSTRPASVSVHAHLDPDCETHDIAGSLGVTSSEGKDPCHEEQLTARLDAAEPTQEAPGLQLDWNGESLVKAFIMQEVLTRPAQRRAVR
jgi:hypothetical protein